MNSVARQRLLSSSRTAAIECRRGRRARREPAGAGRVGQTHGLRPSARRRAPYTTALRPSRGPRRRSRRPAPRARGGPADLLRELHRGERLQQREQRAAEQPGLLAGDDCHGRRVGEPRCRRRWPPPGRAALLLLRQHAGDLGGRPHVRLRARDGVGPGGGRRRVAGEKRRDVLRSRTRNRRRGGDPGKAPDVDCERARGRRGSGLGLHRFATVADGSTTCQLSRRCMGLHGTD